VEIIYVARAADNVFFVRGPVFSSFFGCGPKLSCVKYGCILCGASEPFTSRRKVFWGFSWESFTSHWSRLIVSGTRAFDV